MEMFYKNGYIRNMRAVRFSYSILILFNQANNWLPLLKDFDKIGGLVLSGTINLMFYYKSLGKRQIKKKFFGSHYKKVMCSAKIKIPKAGTISENSQD